MAVKVENPNTAPARKRASGALFRCICTACGATILLLMAGILIELWTNSRLSMSKFGWGFLTSSAWDPARGQFGALSSIYGTIASTVIALVIAVPMSLVIALFLVELAPKRISGFFGTAIELLTAIPSIIYGMWGLFMFAPFLMDHIQPAIQRVALGLAGWRLWDWHISLFGNDVHINAMGWLTKLFSGPPMGIGIFTAGVILALMILPFISAVMRDVLQMVPSVMKESAYGIGATTWEVTKDISVPYGIRGMVGAVFLGLGRAIGETMAVTFVIGNNHNLASSLFASGNSIASTLANEFTEASDPLYQSALIQLGLVLFVITVLFQAVAQIWLRFVTGMGGRR